MVLMALRQSPGPVAWFSGNHSEVSIEVISIGRSISGLH
jgi:hypothetical protein